MDEEESEIIGARCSLTEPYRGYSDGIIVGDYGIQLVVRISSGAEIVAYRDEVIIYEYENIYKQLKNNYHGKSM